METETPDQAGCTPLMYAITAKKADRVHRLLTQETVNAADSTDKTALHHAALSGQAAMVKALLKAGASINARDKDGATPLIYAAMCGYEDVVRLLLAAGADKRCPDGHGRTADAAASRSGYSRVARLLSK